METDSDQNIVMFSGEGRKYGQGELKGEADEGGSFEGEKFVVPGTPIVRSNTPKPLSFGVYAAHPGQTQPGSKAMHESRSAFPMEAPSAPPVPEEYEESINEDALLLSIEQKASLPQADSSEVLETRLDQNPSGSIHPSDSFILAQGQDISHEFLWLFEYGLEMDISVLNDSDRLDGLALMYGPAVLKGYELSLEVGISNGGHSESANGEVVATLLPSQRRGAEVWGVLYRIPARLADRSGNQVALLDKIHAAAAPDSPFERSQVEVYESYRQREITALTFIASATARDELRASTMPAPTLHVEQKEKTSPLASALYVQRLVATARKQRLPANYLEELAALSPATIVNTNANSADEIRATTRTLSSTSGRPEGSLEVPVLSLEEYASNNATHQPVSGGVSAEGEQNTEPLPVLMDQEVVSSASTNAVQPRLDSAQAGRGMVFFALYLALSLLVVLLLAVLQGVGIASTFFIAGFTSLDVPWFVLFYGLIGGCVSCLVRLRWQRHSTMTPPTFVLISWFTRPYIGAFLAVLAYLLVTSGLFVVSTNSGQRETMFALLSVIAGSCEGWLFLRQ